MVQNCIPFGDNVTYDFTGFIYRDVPPFVLVPGASISFDLGSPNDVDVRRNIYFAVANVNPTAPATCSDSEPTQNVAAVSWTQVVSDSQIPSNPQGNFVQGDFELTYLAEASFGFPGGGLIVGFGGSPPGAYADFNCDQVLSITDCADPRGVFYGRFCSKPDLTLGTLDDTTSGCGGIHASLGGMIIVSLDSCGDGLLDIGEQCDDGNTMGGDGCNAGCQIETCYTCSGEPSTCMVAADGTACSDGQFCNGTDTCSSGACTSHGGDPCVGGAECNDVCNEVADNCAATVSTPCTDDGNECTDDICDGAGACVHAGNFAFCDDGMFCNGSDFCSGGSCSFHFGDPCVFSSECNNVCDEGVDMCTPTLGGTPCSDDGTVCTTDACDGLGACAHPPVASGLPCPDEGNECTTDQCDGTGVCGHPPIASGTPCTDDGNECTDDECNGAGLCGHPALMNGTVCDDSDACTQTDQCQSGTCVGSNPIVCAAQVCRAGGTCDPDSGTCTSCPAGYSAGGGGCQKTYAIAESQLDNQPNFCGAADRYSDCSSMPFGFHWTDTGDGSVGAVTRVDVQFDTGVDCSGITHSVGMNATPIGTYPTADQCTCGPAHTTRLFADADTTTYAKGGMNAVSITTNSCSGLSADADGAFATVTVTYADPGFQPELDTGCRSAAKSKLKYKRNATNDAKDKLKWKWVKGDATTQSEFGDPTAGAGYELCVFAETSGSLALLVEAGVPASAMLWSALGTSGYKYRDPAAGQEGIKGILLRGGADAKSKISVKGKGAGLSNPTLPLAPATTGIRVQLTNTASGLCWESAFPLSGITADDHSISASAP